MTKRVETDASITTVKWLRANLGTKVFGALTGTDWRALSAAAHILELRAVGGNEQQILRAFHLVVMQMQPSTRYFAYHAIAFLGEWDQRSELWYAAGLSFDDLTRAPRCQGDRSAWSREEWEKMQEAS